MNTKQLGRIRVELGPTKRWLTRRDLKGKVLDRVVLRRDGKDPEVDMYFEGGTFFRVAINLEFKVQLSLHEDEDDEQEISMSRAVHLPNWDEEGTPIWMTHKEKPRAARKKQATASTRRH